VCFQLEISDAFDYIVKFNFVFTKNICILSLFLLSEVIVHAYEIRLIHFKILLFLMIHCHLLASYKIYEAANDGYVATCKLHVHLEYLNFLKCYFHAFSVVLNQLTTMQFVETPQMQFVCISLIDIEKKSDVIRKLHS
jgi:hypothetical protein